MNVFFRVDSSEKMGSGHLMRCLTLADRLRENGCAVSFISRELTGNMCSYIEKKGYTVYRLPSPESSSVNVSGELAHAGWLGTDWETDAEQTIAVLKKEVIDWLIVDHYALDLQWEAKMRPFVNKIMVIDDLADRKHDCDVLLDQNYNKNGSRYNGLVPENCIQLLGPEYALLRPQFREARENFKGENNEVKRVLVFMGGADPTNETGKVLKAAKLLNRDNIAVDVVIGASNPFKNEIKTMAKQMPNTTCYFDVNNMAELMSSADIGIGASGTSTWERCCVGLPSIVMVLADNQKEIAEELEREGVVVNLGWHGDVTEIDIRDAVQNLLTDSNKRRGLGLKGKMMVDGDGVIRVGGKIIFSSEAVSE